MAGTKRKQVPGGVSSKPSSHKKLKNEPAKPTKKASVLEVLETETDSDPILESDTTKHSGDDDGVSWASDDAPAAQDVPPEDKHQVPPPKKKKSKASAMFPKTNTHTGSSKETHAKQKAVALERRAAKPNANLVARTKQIWERLRRKSHVPLAERKTLITELFEIVTGRVKDFVFKHDSVRVIQTALKYANIDQRKMIARELQREYRTLAESRYAKFLIGKLLVHGDDEVRDLIVPEFYGQVRRMIKHPEASWILDDVYRGIATPTQKAKLLCEWYGAEFAIFKDEWELSKSRDLDAILEKNPEKRAPVMRSLYELINQLVQKRTTAFTMLHDAMLQYFLNVQAGGAEAIEFMEMLKGDEEGDLMKNLPFTQSGARVVCLALSYGNAKDRKHILKHYKANFQNLAYDVHAHQVLLTIFDVIDDTVLVSKSVIAELTGKDLSFEDQTQCLLEVAFHLHARIALLYVFAGKSRAILPSEDLTLLDEIQKIRPQTSKKLPAIRRQELIASLSPPLLSFISDNADTLVAVTFGCQFIAEVLLGATGDRGPASRAVASLARTNPELLQTAMAGRMLKRLVVGGRFNTQTKKVEYIEPPLEFHDILWEIIRDEIVTWAVSSNSFVVVGMLEAEGFQGKEELKQLLRGERKQLEQAMEAGNYAEKRDAPGKSNHTESDRAGNQGTKLLLELI